MHACLYFIRHIGHTFVLPPLSPPILALPFFCSLKPLDIEPMKLLGTHVNRVPVIAKADTLP